MTTDDRAQLEASRRKATGSGVQVLSAEWICQMDLSWPRERAPMTDDPKARDYWKGIELAPKLQVLRRQLTSSFNDDWMRSNEIKLDLDKLPYSLGGMSYAFFEFIRLQGELVKTFAPRRGVSVPATVETDSLSYMLDMFLDHAQRTRHAACFYIRERYSLQHIKEDKKLVGEVPDGIVQNLITQYWERYSETVTNYRDIAASAVARVGLPNYCRC